MKTKLVLWGTNASNEKVLMALEVRPDANKVDIFAFPQSIVKPEFTTKMMEEWRNGTEVEFPEGYQHIERELAIADSILPDDLKADRADLITRAQSEWHFLVLSTKLNEVYRTELGEMKEKVAQLSAYDSEMWDGLKGFWDKVQGQVQERNLFKEHADLLRDGINDLFGKLKDLRTALNNEFEVKSVAAHTVFMTSLDAIETRIKENSKSPSIFNDLKQMQTEYRQATMTRDHRNQVWDRLDAAFKLAKGGTPNATGNSDNSSPSARLENRLKGLNEAIGKMEATTNRDKEELDFQQKKIATSDGQLEAQIRQAKLRMVKERYESKKLKLDEMLVTRVEVEKQLAAAQEKDAKRAARNEATKAEATTVVAESVATETVVAEAVAAEIAEAPALTLSETIETVVEDTVDTVKAVAEVAAEKVEEFIESLTKKEEEKEA